MSETDTARSAIERRLDDHLARGVLPPGRRLSLLTAGFTARGEDALTAAFVRAALARGADPGAMIEIVLQTHLFAGYPRAINALFALREAGVGPPAHIEEPPAPDGREHPFRARGEALCRRIYGASYETLRATIRELHPDIDAWMIDEGYGRVLGRPGVGVVTRELAAVTALVVLDVPRQLVAHLRGARNVGASVAEIEASLEQSELVASERALEAGHRVWRSLMANDRGG